MYVDGKEEGIQILYAEDGKVTQKIAFHRGQKDGVSEYFVHGEDMKSPPPASEWGRLRLREIYKSGTLIESIEYNSSGKASEQCTWQGGSRKCKNLK